MEKMKNENSIYKRCNSNKKIIERIRSIKKKKGRKEK